MMNTSILFLLFSLFLICVKQVNGQRSTLKEMKEKT